jgi:predicted TIM-barrel fold metal-dependent hydrolase
MTEGFDNIYFDTSALADQEIIKESGGIKKIREILTKTILRKPDSVLFGTDWPIGNIEKHINLINSLPISKSEKENIFSKNAIKLFKI